MMYKITYGLVAVPKTRLIKPERSNRGHHSKMYIEMNSTIDAAKYSFYVRTLRSHNGTI